MSILFILEAVHLEVGLHILPTASDEPVVARRLNTTAAESKSVDWLVSLGLIPEVILDFHVVFEGEGVRVVGSD